MILRVQLFAVARELAGAAEIDVTLAEPATVGDLRERLAAERPELADLARRAAFAVNANYASDKTVLSPESEVACIPPVSGG